MINIEKPKTKTVRIRFLDTNKFDELQEAPLYLKKGDFIVIKSEKGEELVLTLGNAVPTEETQGKYQFLRKATKNDILIFDKYEDEAEKALDTCKELVEKLGLKMNLLKAYIPLDRNKIIFYYTAEGRVDFRQLVRDLAKKLKIRIEMRQVGVRDGVQIFGAIGVCGQQCCCSLFLDKFETVNVEMLEEQNLPPTPAKFTGICGRLMCCLSFEKENYSIRKDLPEIDTLVEIEGKKLCVKGYDFIREVIYFIDEEGSTIEYSFDYLDKLGINRQSGCGSCGGCPTNSLTNINSDQEV
ncbi:MAG TPA: hypothetical protein EYH43_00080 [Persephonella sp.]|nr:hypothetical protein [Persephonella sp.]